MKTLDERTFLAAVSALDGNDATLAFARIRFAGYEGHAALMGLLEAVNDTAHRGAAHNALRMVERLCRSADLAVYDREAIMQRLTALHHDLLRSAA